MKKLWLLIMMCFITQNVYSEEIKLENLDFNPDKKIEKNNSNLIIDINELDKTAEKLEKGEINIDINYENNKEETDEILTLRNILKTIDTRFNGADFVESNILQNFYEVSKNGEVIYIEKNGKYIIPVLAEINNGSVDNITSIKRKEYIKNELKKFPKNSLVEYPASNPKADIYVFSDYTCPYCKRFHSKLLEINKLGVNVHYIPFPRNGVRDEDAVNGLKNIMCSKNPSLEFTKAFNNSKNYSKMISPLDFSCENGKSSLHNGLILSDKLKVRGTPYIFLSNGAYLGGWSGIGNFNKLLQRELLKN